MRKPETATKPALPAFAIPALLLSAVVLMRWPFLGNPMIHVDEQFYLLAGQRMTEGWLPYADLWDRKPVGLFLIYAAIRLLGGEGIVQYQLVATLFVAGTGWLVYLIAQRAVAAPAAFAAALLYAAMLAPINGAGGQSPVFYNLFMALAALLVLRAGDAATVASYRRFGVAAMASAGLALQIKYLAVIEGLFFGLWLVWSGRRHGRAPLAMIGDATVFAGAALIPTLAAITWFAGAGALDPFLKANFLSIFQRSAAPAGFERDALAHTWKMISIPLLSTAGALALVWVRGPVRDRTFLTLWAAFAAAGFLAIGNYYDHYALPLLVPAAILLSRLFAARLVGPLLFTLLFGLMTLYGLARYPSTANSRAIAASMTRDIAPVAARGECLFVADAPLVLYLTTHACGPWRYSFPFHLIDATEAHSGDSDQPYAMRAILDARPGAIVTGDPDFPPSVQRGTMALLRQRLARGYVRVSRYPHGDRAYTVWLRRDLARTAVSAPAP